MPPGVVITLSISLEVKPDIELILTSTIVMNFLRKSKLSADTPAPTPGPLKRLVQKLTFRRDSKALAATSLAIAPAFNDTRGTSSDGATAQGTDAIRQTTYAAVRTAVEVTKESSDLYFSLMTVVRAMSTLMRNYHVSTSCSWSERFLTLCPVSHFSKQRVTRRV